MGTKNVEALEALIMLLKSLRIYKFKDLEGLYLINESNPVKIKLLMEEYKEKFEEKDFLNFLEEKGYLVIDLDAEYYV